MLTMVSGYVRCSESEEDEDDEDSLGWIGDAQVTLVRIPAVEKGKLESEVSRWCLYSV